MGKMSEELEKRLDENKYELYDALKQILPRFDSIVRTEECDHDVGICWCADHNAIFIGKHVIAKIEQLNT